MRWNTVLGEKGEVGGPEVTAIGERGGKKTLLCVCVCGGK